MSNPRPKRRGDHKLFTEDVDDPHDHGKRLSEETPCVFYEADELFNISHISKNVHDLVGIQREPLIGVSLLFEEAVAPADRALLQLKLAELNSNGVTSLIHRLVDDRGRLVRVAHSLRRVVINGQSVIRGNLLPLTGCESDAMAIDIGLVSKFIHKIGNHFQLLNLILDSMRHKGANFTDLELVQETTENAINLTRTFSSYLEQPQLSTNVNLSELMETAVGCRASDCRAKQIEIVFNGGGIGTEATIYGDVAFLDLALGAILDNAINASQAGGVIFVEISAPPEISMNGVLRTIIVRVLDKGSGIPADQIETILEPFHPMRPGHDGITLDLASRYIELHGGLFQIQSCEGKGMNFEIAFPILPLHISSTLEKVST